MQDWKIVNSSKYSLSCCTHVFHRCRFILAFSVLAFSTLAYSYLRIPYLHILSPGTFVFRTCVFSHPWRSIAMSVPVCAFVCVSVRWHRPISRTTYPVFTKFLCMLTMAVARSSSGDVAIRYIYFRFYE